MPPLATWQMTGSMPEQLWQGVVLWTCLAMVVLDTHVRFVSLCSSVCCMLEGASWHNTQGTFLLSDQHTDWCLDIGLRDTADIKW
jgi:hypothetical protein